MPRARTRTPKRGRSTPVRSDPPPDPPRDRRDLGPVKRDVRIVLRATGDWMTLYEIAEALPEVPSGFISRALEALAGEGRAERRTRPGSPVSFVWDWRSK